MKHAFTKLTILLSLILVIWAYEDTAPNDPTNLNVISFSSPEEGQMAYFQRYTSTCHNLNLDFELGY